LHRALFWIVESETGYWSEHFAPEVTCVTADRPLCYCDDGDWDALVAGLSQDQRLDLNRASARELQRLPGIGPGIAERIVAYRDENPFDTIDELLQVPGIGPTRFSRLRPLVRVGDGQP
jgi:competence ComEA-like helix-hairpin-helix protein